MQMMKSMWNAHVRTGLLIGIISGMTWGLNDVLANLYSTSLGSVLLLGMIFFFTHVKCLSGWYFQFAFIELLGFQRA